MARYGGIDRHANHSVIVVIDDQDHVVDHKRVPNHLDPLRARLAPYHQELSGLVVASTDKWSWRVDGRMESGSPVHVATTAAMQQYEGMQQSHDLTEAQWLAHRLRLHIFPQGSLYPQEERGGRDLLRKRMQLVQHRTANLLRIQTQSARHTGHTWRGHRMKQLTGEEVEAIMSAPHVA